MAEPPSEPGVVHVTVAWVLPAVADTPVGTPGTVAGVTAFDCADSLLAPATFTASTVNVYVVPLVSAETVCVVAVELNVTGVCATAETYGVTTYEVIGAPPLAPGVHVTVADVLPRVAVPIV